MVFLDFVNSIWEESIFINCNILCKRYFKLIILFLLPLICCKILFISTNILWILKLVEQLISTLFFKIIWSNVCDKWYFLLYTVFLYILNKLAWKLMYSVLKSSPITCPQWMQVNWPEISRMFWFSQHYGIFGSSSLDDSLW